MCFFRHVRYTLNFDSMELDDPSKYDAVRRLTNSDSLVSNPYFPSKWKIYWWNNFEWEEYNKVNVSSILISSLVLLFIVLFCSIFISNHCLICHKLHPIPSVTICLVIDWLISS